MDSVLPPTADLFTEGPDNENINWLFPKTTDDAHFGSPSWSSSSCEEFSCSPASSTQFSIDSTASSEEINKENSYIYKSGELLIYS